MKTIIQYECEICKRRSEYKEAIEGCEVRGKANLTKYPVGMIFGGYENMTFITAEFNLSAYSPHCLDASLWACRDNGAGDNVDDGEYCGNLNEFVPFDPPNPNHPTFVRLVKKMKEIHPTIPLTVWDGKKIVPINEFLKKSHVKKS